MAGRMANTTQGTVNSGQLTQSALDDLLSLGLGEEVDLPASSSGAWNSSSLYTASLNDPWAAPQQQNAAVYPTAALENDPCAPTSSVAAPVASISPRVAPTTADPFSAWLQTLEPTPVDMTGLSASYINGANGSRFVMVTLAEELPFSVVVTNDHLDQICSSCFASKKKDQNLSRCIGCKVVHYCNRNCQKNDWIDHKHECSFMKNYAPAIPPVTSRLIARIAMRLRRADAQEPAFNGRVYDELMDHIEEIPKDPNRRKVYLSHLSVLHKYMGKKFVPDPALLMSIFGKIEINSFGTQNNNYMSGQGLYLGLSVHDHSCIPDAYVHMDGKKASLRTSDKNKKYSKDLTLSYTGLLYSNQDRQEKLRNYYFTCTCARCSDPTLDFLYNSARSTCCPDSYCLLNPDAKEMKCNKCGSISGITVKEAVAANEEIRVFSKNSGGSTSVRDGTFDVPTLVKAYEKFSKILSPLNLNLLILNHNLVLNAFNLKKDQPPTATLSPLWVMAVAANEEIRVFSKNSGGSTSVRDGTFDVPTLVKAYEKFSKILSPLNLNLLILNHNLVLNAFNLKKDNPVTRKYAERLLPGYRRYCRVGDPDLSEELIMVACSMSYDFPPIRKCLEIFKEALAAFSVSHGLEHPRTLMVGRLLASVDNVYSSCIGTTWS